MAVAAPPKPKPLWLEMALPAAAGGLAVCFSHPLELTKIRLQLDQERAAAGTPRAYKGWADCIASNWRSDGLRGLQRGLSLGIGREVVFNAVRIGLYNPVLALAHGSGSGAGGTAPSGPEKMASGMLCGALGGCCVNPIEVLKCRFQSGGGLTGHQHNYSSVPEAVAAFARDEGLAGCVKGLGTSTLRGMIGPGSQIVAYGEMKAAAAARGANADSAATHVVCALGSAAVSVAIVNPVRRAIRALASFGARGWHVLGAAPGFRLTAGGRPPLGRSMWCARGCITSRRRASAGTLAAATWRGSCCGARVRLPSTRARSRTTSGSGRTWCSSSASSSSSSCCCPRTEAAPRFCLRDQPTTRGAAPDVSTPREARATCALTLVLRALSL